jgi:hypothetical protein
MLSPRLLLATGYEEPNRWLVSWDTPVALAAPEFFFELEMKRLAAELQPGVKAVAPPLDEDFNRAYAAQTAAADLADFLDALQTKRISPPDAQAAQAAHEARRSSISGEASPALLPEFPSEFADYHDGAAAYKEKRLDDARAAWTKLLARPAAERHYRTVWASYMLGRIAIDEREWEKASTAFASVRDAVKEGYVRHTRTRRCKPRLGRAHPPRAAEVFTCNTPLSRATRGRRFRRGTLPEDRAKRDSG